MRPRRYFPQSSESHGSPLVAVDLVVFTFDRNKLQALLVQVKEGPFAGKWAFPGGLVRADESLDEAAKRELQERTGLKNVYLEQLYTFGRPERDPALRVVSASYLALVPRSNVRLLRADKYSGIRWCPSTALSPLAYDHRQVARLALQRLHA